MGYNFDIKEYYVVKKEDEYPWSCQPEPNRTIRLFTDDVLTKASDGTFTKHTGICCINIRLAKEQVKFIKKPIALRLL